MCAIFDGKEEMDGLLWNLVQALMVPRGISLIYCFHSGRIEKLLKQLKHETPKLSSDDRNKEMLLSSKLFHTKSSKQLNTRMKYSERSWPMLHFKGLHLCIF